MSHVDTDVRTTGLGRRYLAYNDHLFLVAALRQLSGGDHRLGLLPDRLVETADRLSEITDQLEAIGVRPTRRFVGAEQELWVRTLALAAAAPLDAVPTAGGVASFLNDTRHLQSVWDTFHAFVKSLPDEFFDEVPALDPRMLRGKGLEHLLGHRRLHPECV